MSCFRKTRQLIPRNIVPNWTVWRQQSTKSVQNCQIVMMSCFIKTTLNFTSLWQHDKNYCSLTGMSCLIRLIRLILHRKIFIYLDLCKILLLEKISLLGKIAKSTLKSYSPIKLRSFGRMELLRPVDQWSIFVPGYARDFPLPLTYTKTLWLSMWRRHSALSHV